MHDLLLLLSIIWGDYDVDKRYWRSSRNKTSHWTGWISNQARIYKIDDTFFRRKLLFTYVSDFRMIMERPWTNYFTENILDIFHKSLCGREQMHIGIDLKMWKLQHTKQDKTHRAVNWVETQESYSKTCTTTTTTTPLHPIQWSSAPFETLQGHWGAQNQPTHSIMEQQRTSNAEIK